jgi:hypothetical protein
LDNADDADVFFAGFTNMPSGAENSTPSTIPFFTYLPQSLCRSILITSRNRGAAFKLTNANQNVNNIHLMEEEDASPAAQEIAGEQVK